MSERQIVLLRGINVGGHNKVPMADLRALLEGAGYTDVRTYVQSGNVALGAEAAGAALEAEIEQLLEGRYGFPVRICVRTKDELERIVAADPLGDVADVPKLKHVAFLGTELDPEIAQRLESQAKDLAPERIVVRGREIYTWYPNGVQDSAAVKLISDKRLKTTVTARNWNTVTKLLELATA